MSDELPYYKDALLEEYHTVEQPKPTGKPGRPRNPRKVIDPIIVACYNFEKPHFTLSKNSDRTYTPGTPAQVAGITDSPWSMEFIPSSA